MMMMFVQYAGMYIIQLKTMPLGLLACKFKVLHSTFLEQCRVMLHLFNHSVGIALVVLL